MSNINKIKEIEENDKNWHKRTKKTKTTNWQMKQHISIDEAYIINKINVIWEINEIYNIGEDDKMIAQLNSTFL